MRTVEAPGPWLVVMLAASWCFWGAAALLAGAAGGPDPWTPGLLVLGWSAPSLVVALVLARPGEGGGRRRLLRGLLSVRQLRAAHLLVVLLPPGLALLATLVALATELEPAPAWRAPAAGAFAELLALQLLLALAQELVWRGFAQERLQRGLDALTAALLVALLWGLWQLPLFAVPGTGRAALGLGSAAFTLHLAALVPLAIVLAALYNATRGSVLATTALLTSASATAACVQFGPAGELVLLASWSAVALGLLAHYGPATLSSAPARRRRGDRAPRRRRPEVDPGALASERTFTP